jgi:hypothetical protein
MYAAARTIPLALITMVAIYKAPYQPYLFWGFSQEAAEWRFHWPISAHRDQPISEKPHGTARF